MTEQKPKAELGLLEEDDEFEEFPAEGKYTYIIFLIFYINMEHQI